MGARGVPGSIRLVASALVVLALNGVPPPHASATEPAPAPRVTIDDAPFVRTQTVELTVLTDFVTSEPLVVERRASNTPATELGVLVDGVPVPPIGPWTLAPGPPGPRTVYAQVLYANGLWSPVASATVTADFSAPSRLYLDLEPRGGVTDPLALDWHGVVETPATRIVGRAGPLVTTPGSYVHLNGGNWGVGLQVSSGQITAGTYHPTVPTGSDPPTPVAAVVTGPEPGVRCDGAGTFVIHEIAFDAGGDVSVLDADFLLACGLTSAGGSIRYGSTRQLPALDQSADRLFSGLVDIGDRAATQRVTFTNVGTVPASLGTARLEGHAGDFTIEDDGCGGRTLDVGASCTIDTAFVPVERGMRQVSLLVADPTVRGERKVVLIGWGVQPTSVRIESVSVPAYGPAPATFVVTLEPPAPGGAILYVGGRQLFGPVVVTAPDRATYTYTADVGPGRHTVLAEFRQADYFAASSDTTEVTVGTGTSLALSTVSDDGVAAGETAPLIARLTTGGPIDGGTLRIRDGITDEVLASMTTTGDDPALTLTVLPGLGTHPYSAEFVPPDASVQASNDALDLLVVAGPRPETVMDASTLYSNVTSVQSPFSSTTPGVTFQCRLWLNPWYPCTSPGTWSTSWGGEHQISVRAVRADGLADRTPATRGWIVDTSPPVGSIDIVGGGQYTRSRSVTLDVPGYDTYGITHLRLTNNWSSETTLPYTPRITWTLPAEDGTHTIGVWWRDAAGTWSYPASAAITLDATAPRVTVPVNGFRVGSTVSGGLVPVDVRWTGVDATSGIARYEVGLSTNGGAYGTVADALTTSSLTRSLAPGRSYRFRVRAFDRAGNAGAWTYGATFRVSALQQSSTAISYSGTWRTTSSTSFWGGSAKYATAAGARASFRFTGRSVAWIASVGPTRGSARVYVNGMLVTTVSLYAPTNAHRRVVYAQSWSTSATRTVQIRVLGTSGRPRIDVDAIAWGS